MSSQMQCIVTNQTGETITNVIILHQWEGNEDQPNNGTPITSMENNAQINFPINVGSGGSDDWTVNFTDPNGNVWYRNSKQCDITSDDINSGNPVYVNLLPTSQGFSIELPVSSSCTDNYYNENPAPPS